MPDPPSSFGWSRDRPDHRDRPPGAPGVRRLLRGLGYKKGRRRLPAATDWREVFPPADPAPPGRRAAGRDRAGSVAFVQWAAAQGQGDWAGAVGLRAALRAVVDCGVPPARLWPGDTATPPPATALAGSRPRFRRARYVRLDAAGAGP